MLTAFVSSSSRRVRQYVGLALVILAYLGGSVGWTWAVQTVDADRAAPTDTTEVVVPGPGDAPPAE
jgi:drug/metabolite transporter (DMT)-like permease